MSSVSELFLEGKNDGRGGAELSVVPSGVTHRKPFDHNAGTVTSDHFPSDLRWQTLDSIIAYQEERRKKLHQGETDIYVYKKEKKKSKKKEVIKMKKKEKKKSKMKDVFKMKKRKKKKG